MNNYYDEDYYNDYRDNRSLILITIGIIVAVVVIVASTFGYMKSSYNSIIDLDENVKTAEANLQTAMQSRLRKLPDVVTLVENYAEHEEVIFQAITNLNGSMENLTNALKNGDSTSDIVNADALVARDYTNVLALVQDVPEIQSAALFQDAIAEIAGASNYIDYCQSECNKAIEAYNKKVRLFPGNIWAKIYGFEVRETFKADSEAYENSLVKPNK